jgi:D-tagatose-1,6-bisphosphate aldolase subunit GatZ/KbaZ
MAHPLLDITPARRAGKRPGITSVCSAHPVVIEATLRHGLVVDQPVLIEATCNQVNQDGGYTGMTPARFRDFVFAVAARVGYPAKRIILGGDHLGPNPWKHLPADQAMVKAEGMIAEFAAAGFTKLHLDTSMGCLDEPVALADAVTAQRAARLAAVAEAHRQGDHAPVYVIGTEVPVPGGATDDLDHMQITAAAAVATTYAIHQTAFAQADQAEAFSRVIALVVQPGVEFGNDTVIPYAPDQARDLSAALMGLPGVVFEAHSTDYQSESGLRQLVGDGFSILKVGPWLTFALREALYGLDAIADVLDGNPPQNRLMTVMDGVMQASPANWANYYHGNAANLWVQRHFSYSDRIRYYWPDPAAEAAVRDLKARLIGHNIPIPVLRQYLPALAQAGAADFDSLLLRSVEMVLSTYHAAIHA